MTTWTLVPPGLWIEEVNAKCAVIEYEVALRQILFPFGNVGWKLDLLHTIFTYILGSRKYDPKVAKALADWPDVDAKVYVPNEASFSPEYREAFKTFSENIFDLCRDVEVPLKRCLAAVLIMHYSTVVAVLPHCKLIQRMQRYQSHDILSTWSNDVQSWFHHHNSEPPPRSFDDAGMVVIKNLTEKILSLEATVRAQHTTNIALGKALEAVADMVKDFKTETTAQLHRILIAVAPNDSQPETVGLKRKRKSSMQTVMDSYFTAPVDSRRLVHEDTNVGVDSLSLLFCDWYIRQGFKSKNEFSKKARVVSYLKSFLPDGTTIPKPPEITSSSYSAWKNNIMTLSVSAENALIAFLASSREGGKNKQGNKWRNCHDQLKDIQKTKLPSITAASVIDEVTPTSVLSVYNNIGDDALFQRKVK